MSEKSELLSEQRGHVGVITFNRPERRNALTPAMLIELHDTLGAWAEQGERVKGVEPSPPAWKAGALPLSYTR